jgi:GNAT superfamily N-acetyltransferase
MPSTNTSGIEYIRASLKDAEILTQLRMEFLEEYWGKQDKSLRENLYAKLMVYFKTATVTGTYVSFLARTGKEWVGIGGMVMRQQPGGFKIPNGKIAYIMNMYTKPGYRKQGVAKHILHLLMEEAKNLDCEALELHATQDGEPVYQKAGFNLHPEPTYRLILKK